MKKIKPSQIEQNFLQDVGENNFDIEEKTTTTNPLDEEIEARMATGEKPFEKKEKWEEEFNKLLMSFIKPNGAYQIFINTDGEKDKLKQFIRQNRQEAKREVIKQVSDFFGLTEKDLPAFPDKDFNLLNYILSVGKRNWYQIAYKDARIELLEEEKRFNESNLKKWGNNGWEIILEGLKNK